MKKFLVISLLLSLSMISLCQGVDFRIRGGLNIQKSQSAEGDFSFLPHFGIMAGKRISTFGIYGEVLYSTHDNQIWSEPASYIVPAVIARFYAFKLIYIEGGLPYFILMDEQLDGGFFSYPDKKVGFYAGLGLTSKRFELGLRSMSNPFPCIMAMASIKF